jgi:hypothetical protein
MCVDTLFLSPDMSCSRRDTPYLRSVQVSRIDRVRDPHLHSPALAFGASVRHTVPDGLCQGGASVSRGEPSFKMTPGGFLSKGSNLSYLLTLRKIGCSDAVTRHPCRPYAIQSRRDGKIIAQDVQQTKSRRDDTGFTSYDTPSGLAFRICQIYSHWTPSGSCACFA